MHSADGHSPESHSPPLRETQRALCAAILGDAPGAADALLPDDPALEIYRNTCRSALLGSLRLAYPAVRQLVGAEFFDAVADRFLAQHLPDSACLNDYGAPFAQFLAGFAPAASIPYLSEVAGLEWAINRALHAPEPVSGTTLDVARLADRDPSAWQRLRLAAHPSLTLLSLRWPADRIWRAVLDGDEAAMQAIDLADGPVRLLIERDARAGGAVQVRRLPPAAWLLTTRLIEGVPLPEAVGEAERSVAGTEERALLQRILADHLAGGRFITLEEHTP